MSSITKGKHLGSLQPEIQHIVLRVIPELEGLKLRKNDISLFSFLVT